MKFFLFARRALLLTCLLLLLPSFPSHAQVPTYGNRTFERSPQAGPPGTVISVSGTGCVEHGQAHEEAIVQFIRAEGDVEPYEIRMRYQIAPNGTWEGNFRVPEEAPVGWYGLTAYCLLGNITFAAGRSNFYLANDPVYGNRTFKRSPSWGPPGTVISVSGTWCIEGGQPFDKAHVSFFRRTGQGGDPFDRSKTYSIRSDGSWSGDLLVPSESPRGWYVLSVMCTASDMAFPVGDATFYVGDSLPTGSPSSPAKSPHPGKPSSSSSSLVELPSTEEAEPTVVIGPSRAAAALVKGAGPPPKDPGSGSLAAIALVTLGSFLGASYWWRRKSTGKN